MPTSKKNIFIYAGPHRSGSTFLLSFIFPHVKNLKDIRSIDWAGNDAVLDAMEAHPMFFDPKPYQDRVFRKFDEIKEDNVLIADEEFFGDYGKVHTGMTHVATPFYDNQNRVHVLKELFGDAKVILTPRRQDLWIESAYMHFIHNFHSMTFDEYTNPGMYRRVNSWYVNHSINPSVDCYALDWSKYIHNYYDAFGKKNVLVIPQEMVSQDLPEALGRLYEFMNVEPYFPTEDHRPNRSLSKTALKWAMILNRFISTEHNRFGFLPVHPFMPKILELRAKNDNKLLWFLTGISRRISMHWFLGQVVSKYNYQRPELFTPENREKLLKHYETPNKEYAKMIGIDLSKYGYY